MKVVIASDQHLGYANSDKRSFSAFLGQLSEDKEVTDLVLLGDVVDMWRRDASGVFLENWDIISKIHDLGQKMTVYYIAGNHDYHVLSLINHDYPFKFLQDLVLTDGQHKYRFKHGWEFDPAQKIPFMEALCRVMSDQAGDFESGAWATLTREWTDFQYWLRSFLDKNNIRQSITDLQLPPEQRLKDTIGAIEGSACSSVRPGEVLIFGHTHRPFVNTTETAVNSGSWVTDAPVHNTYVELSNGKPRLFQFGGREITERIEC